MFIRLKSSLSIVLMLIFLSSLVTTARAEAISARAGQEPAEVSSIAAAVSEEDPSDLDIENLSEIINKSENYKLYLADYKKKSHPDIVVEADLSQITRKRGTAEFLEDYEGRPGTSLSTGEEGYVQWNINVPQEGLYNIFIEYYAPEGKGSQVERSVWVNEIIPYFEARSILFTRIWTDAAEVFRVDSKGNEIKPDITEINQWQSTYIMDSSGNYTEPLSFFFYKGDNTIAFKSAKEPLVIGSLTLKQAPALNDYQQQKEQNDSDGTTAKANEQEDRLYIQQAEHGNRRSDVMIYPVNLRSSPMIDPVSYYVKKLNAIGGNNWSDPGQWVEWDVDVDEPGYYEVAFKYRQYFNKAAYSCRRMYVDGVLLYDDLDAVRFGYNSQFENKIVSDRNGAPILFQFDAGRHTIRLETSLGPISEIVAEADEAIYNLNLAYRKIIMVTGPDPDAYRDYQLDITTPDVIDIFIDETARLKALSELIYSFQQEKNARSAILDQFVFQLEDFVEDPDTIPSRLIAFKQNISALSTFVQETRKQPLEIDYLMVYTPGTSLPIADTGFFGKLMHEVKSFISSFIVDYDEVGNTGIEGKTIEVWTFTGRDQAEVLRKLIDDSFTTESKINVNLQVLQATVLLPAVVAGQGPDVTLNNGVGEPVNYALRNAVADMSRFDGYSDVIRRFNQSAVIPAQFNGGQYGIPEMETFYMLFYRTDILTDLALKVPETWGDVKKMLPVLKRNGMEFGLFPNLGTYCMFLYQKGGELYAEDSQRTLLDSKTALDEFNDWTHYYIDYKLPVDFDFNNRFRSGEIPVGVSDYSTYNFLTVFAPELKGLWNFTKVPGTANTDGTINSASPSGVTYSMIMNACKDKQSAWDFIDWWTSTDIQTRFGLEMESILGSSARYTTANKAALERLPWSNENYRSLAEQWEQVFGVQQVPGGYFTARHVENAFREVINTNNDARETLLRYSRTINLEIINKRRQYNLPISDEGSNLDGLK
ncbi:MAG: extracellular solute-binding protein [Saccharofermentanales bacterium]